MTTRAGRIAVVGRPNAGKSTLLNHLVGQKLAITSHRPQSTRKGVTGILTSGDTQLVFVDTPGLMEPTYHLQRAMRHEALLTIQNSDAVLHLVDATSNVEEFAALVPSNERGTAPVIMVLNKTDRLSPEALVELRRRFPHAHLVSAATGEGTGALVAALGEIVPESDFLYDAEDASTQSMRFFVTEAIREAAFEQLEQELPYAVTSEVEEYLEDRNPVYIRVTVFVERESQKRILVGKGGTRIRELGRAAREKIEQLTGAPVYLDLWIKVLHNWRRNPAALHRFGFSLPEDAS
jgi:GTP-binding protein Era